MEKVSAQSLFDYNNLRRLIPRDKFKPSHTILLVFLDQNEKVARHQLSFRWRGLTNTVMVLGSRHNSLEKRGIVGLLTESGTGVMPYPCPIEEALGDKDINTQVHWVMENLPGRSVRNIIINRFDGIDKAFCNRLNMALPKRPNQPAINFYSAKAIERGGL